MREARRAPERGKQKQHKARGALGGCCVPEARYAASETMQSSLVVWPAPSFPLMTLKIKNMVFFRN